MIYLYGFYMNSEYNTLLKSNDKMRYQVYSDLWITGTNEKCIVSNSFVVCWEQRVLPLRFIFQLNFAAAAEISARRIHKDLHPEPLNHCFVVTWSSHHWTPFFSFQIQIQRCFQNGHLSYKNGAGPKNVGVSMLPIAKNWTPNAQTVQPQHSFSQYELWLDLQCLLGQMVLAQSSLFGKLCKCLQKSKPAFLRGGYSFFDLFCTGWFWKNDGISKISRAFFMKHTVPCLFLHRVLFSTVWYLVTTVFSENCENMYFF